MRRPLDRLTRAVDRLSEPHKLVFTLAFYEELDDEEIAQQLGLAREDVEALRAEAVLHVDDARRGENLRAPHAEEALVRRFVDVVGIASENDRLANLRPLIVPTVGDEALEAALRDIARGDGNEMHWQRRDGRLMPPALHSVYSSCALALNVFGPWRLAPASLSALGAAGYATLEFEVKLPIFGGRGTPPNLDLVLTTPDRVVAIESKLTEHLVGGYLASFKKAYNDGVAIADESWRAMFERLKTTPDAFSYLDAAQLVRHYLGLKTQVGAGQKYAGKAPTLAYIYWEPSNADDLQPCRTHREEVRAFERSVADPELRFVSLSYRQLWNEWAARRSPQWLREHVDLLRKRYDIALDGG